MKEDCAPYDISMEGGFQDRVPISNLIIIRSHNAAVTETEQTSPFKASRGETVRISSKLNEEEF